MKADTLAERSVPRRTLLQGSLAFGGLFLLGCAPANSNESSSGSGAAQPKTAATNRAMTVYRDPSCGCCKSWAEQARQAGFQVTLRDDPDMAAVKQRLGVPTELASCHTAVVNGVVIEGHVPFKHIDRLLGERPSDIKGIAVPGMPRGSPGMEMPDGSTDPFEVIAFDGAGNRTVFQESIRRN